VGDLAGLVESSADPSAVRLVLERLESAAPGTDDRLKDDPRLAAAVVAVAAASRSLPVVLETDAGAFDVLAALDERPAPPAGDELDEAALGRWASREYLRIAARDLLGLDDLPAVGAHLSAHAADVLAAALVVAGAGDLVVVGMGKLGGTELNYASDVDLMLVAPDGAAGGDTEGRARELLRVARTVFRVDANLRPEGRDGPLVRSLGSYRAYWERWAAPWEFQALLKARPVAGPAELAEGFAKAAAEALWGRTLAADDLRSLRAMKARTEAEVARRGLATRDLKRAAGGIRDIEFSVQLLQLVHGRHDPDLRSPTTLRALHELAGAGYVDERDAGELDRCYRLLRTVEHRLQLRDGAQVHAVPPDAASRELLARVLGYRDSPDVGALGRFESDLAGCRASVRALHERIYFRPLLEAFAGAPGAMDEAATETRLAAFGFADAERTRQAVRELTRGLTRASRLMEQLLPLVLGWLADSPDPDGGLLGLRNLASGTQRSAELARAFRESPETARRLCTVLGTSSMVAELLGHNPDLVPLLGDDGALVPRPAGSLADAARATVEWRDAASRQRGLKRFKDRELARIAVRDILDLADLRTTATGLTALAEATLSAALGDLAPPVPFAVIALGRFGGGELSYGSDLDVLFVYEGEGVGAYDEATRAATSLMRLVRGGTPAARVYELDADLRPEGRDGPLARSVDAFSRYFERWAEGWERLAMLRARPVAGDRDVGERFLSLLDDAVWSRPPGAEEVREIRRIKARVERERIPAGEDPDFHLKLGRGSLADVEFTTQLLQLQNGIRGVDTVDALERLVAAGVVAPDDRDVLVDAYRFCEAARSRLFLVRGGPGDSLPEASDELRRLARSLGTTGWELREAYRRVTRRSRGVVERLFYGRE
jgi:glutamate-ammonia-ligase adenylyltransferase